MLESFTIETFANRIAEQFGVSTEAGAIALELLAATSLAGTSRPVTLPPGRRAPFSLEFLGPPEPILPQGTYAFEHDTLGAFELFVVPIGRDERGTRYEAVFT